MTGFFPKLTKFISQPSPVLDKQRSSFASQLIDPISIFTSTRYLRLAFPLIKTNLKKNQFTYDGISAGRAATQTTANVKTIYKTYVKKTTKTQSNSEINNGNSIIQLTVLIIVMVDHWMVYRAFRMLLIRWSTHSFFYTGRWIQVLNQYRQPKLTTCMAGGPDSRWTRKVIAKPAIEPLNSHDLGWIIDLHDHCFATIHLVDIFWLFKLNDELLLCAFQR